MEISRQSPYFCIPASTFGDVWESGDALLVLGIGEDEARRWADRFFGSPEAVCVVNREMGVGK